MDKASVVAVILNWKRPFATLDCLSALDNRATVVIVDNGSGDQSIEALRRANPDVPLLALGENRGYAGGNNAGMAWAMAIGCEWVLLLNDDVLLAPDALDRLLEAAGRDPTVGFVGPLILHAKPADTIQSAGGSFDARWRSSHRGQNQKDHGQFTNDEVVPWLTGCVMLVRARMIAEIGPLDERFFLYHEELEWCLRGQKAGWKALFVPGARAWHAGVDAAYEPKPYVTYYMARNHFLLLAKQRAGWLPWIDAIFQTGRTLLSWTVRPKWRLKRAHRNALWHAAMDALRGRWGPSAQAF